jgi:hypothetical protein
MYWVTYPEYGNSAAVDLGDMELITAATHHDTNSKSKTEHRDDQEINTNRNNRNRSRSRSRSSSFNQYDRKRSRSRERRHRRDNSRSPRRSHRHSPSRSRSDSRERNRINHIDKSNKTDDLLAKVIQSERDASAAVGRNYGHRPTSYKGALSMKLDRYTVRKKSPSPERGQRRNRKRSRTPEKSPPKVSKPNLDSSIEQSSRLKTLKEKYGDASAK